jgi:hypothetical protein
MSPFYYSFRPQRSGSICNCIYSHLRCHFLLTAHLHTHQNSPHVNLKRRLADSSCPVRNNKRLKPGPGPVQSLHWLSADNPRNLGNESGRKVSNGDELIFPGHSQLLVSSFNFDIHEYPMTRSPGYGDHFLDPSRPFTTETQLPEANMREIRHSNLGGDSSAPSHGRGRHEPATTAGISNVSTGGSIYGSSDATWLGMVSPTNLSDTGMPFVGTEFYVESQYHDSSAMGDDFQFINYENHNILDSRASYDLTATAESISDPLSVDDVQSVVPHLHRHPSSDSSEWSEIVVLDDSKPQEPINGQTAALIVSSRPESRVIAPRRNSGSSNSMPKRRPRGQFRTKEMREETSATRKLRACVRCRIQKIRVSLP